MPLFQLHVFWWEYLLESEHLDDGEGTGKISLKRTL